MTRPSQAARIVIGLAAGCVTGALLGERAAILGEIGRLVIQAIKVAAIPLLMFTILHAVVTTDIRARSGFRMAIIAGTNAIVALAIGLALSNLLKPGHHLASAPPPATGAARTAETLDPIKVLANFVPESLAQPFADNAVLPIVLMSVLAGVALRKLRIGGAATAGIENAVDVARRASELILGWMVRLIPIAVFAVVAKSVGQQGLQTLRGLAWYLGVGLLGLALHPLITYQLWLVLYARIGVRRFWRAAREPVVYAVGSNSSLATLPVTLASLRRLGVSEASSTLGACVGTNLNNDGIILYEGMAVLFVAQAYGIHLTLGQQVLAAISCLAAAMGIAGVPEAGFVSLSLVLATVGLPLEILALLLTVDWILARGRSVVNVLSDMMVSILIDRWEGRRFEGESGAGGGLRAASAEPR